MGLGLRVLPVFPMDTIALEAFIENLGDEQETFRYFKNRGLEVIQNHLFTFLLLKDNISVGYGHLDAEDDLVWLGIVVRKEYQGRGFAKKIMQILMDKSLKLHLDTIHLSVDNTNKRAIGLYQKFGFDIVKTKENSTIMQRQISKVNR